MPHKSRFNPATGKFEFPTKTTELTVYADAHGQVNAMKLDGYLYKNIVLPRYGTIEQIKVRALLETEIEKDFQNSENLGAIFINIPQNMVYNT